MIGALDRAECAFGAGSYFVAFGISYLAAASTVLPAVLPWPGTSTDRRDRVRRMLGAAFRALPWLIGLLGLGRVQNEGLEHVRATGGSLVIYPEDGTYSVPGKPLRFKCGATQIAVRAKIQIVPMLVARTPPTLPKQLRGHHAPDWPRRLRIRVLPVRCTEDFIGAGGKSDGKPRPTIDPGFVRLFSTSIGST